MERPWATQAAPGAGMGRSPDWSPQATQFSSDLPDHEQTFWGFAASRRSPRFRQGELGFDYLGIDQARAIYAQASASRPAAHPLGEMVRHRERFDLNYDAIVQWGHFSGAPVRAWAFSTETGYWIANTHWKPRFSIRADFASGDKDPKDPKLQSFNPLFPGSSYAGAVGLFGPTNLSDVSPEVRDSSRRGIIIILEAPSYWRTSLQDGIYSTTRTLLIPPTAGEGSYVGSNPGIVTIWQATPHFLVRDQSLASFRAASSRGRSLRKDSGFGCLERPTDFSRVTMKTWRALVRGAALGRPNGLPHLPAAAFAKRGAGGFACRMSNWQTWQVALRSALGTRPVCRNRAAKLVCA